MDPITIISQSATAGGLTGARPALTLFLLQLYGLFLVKPTLPEGTQWLLNEYVVGVCGALVVVEHFVRTEPDFEEVMRIPNQILGLVVALAGALLLVGLGEDPERWKEVASGALIWTAGAGGEGSMGTLTLSMVLAAGSSLGLGWVRSRAMEALGALSLPSRWWRWIEAGGVTGAVAMLVLLPFLSLALALILALATGASAGLVWWAQRVRDQRQRRACANPSCAARPRVEASICPACKTALRPVEPEGAATPVTAS